MLLFFWAHWCADCKYQGPILAQLRDRYAAKGLQLVAPTQYYGYVAGGEDATPAQEKPYMARIRMEFYPGLKEVPAPISVEAFQAYGVSTTPTYAWAPATDAEGEAITYDIQVLNVNNVVLASAVGISGTTQQFAAALQFQTRYRWKVRAVDASGNRDATPAFHSWTVASTETNPPSASPTLAPAPNSAGWNRGPVTISWNWSGSAPLDTGAPEDLHRDRVVVHRDLVRREREQLLAGLVVRLDQPVRTGRGPQHRAYGRAPTAVSRPHHDQSITCHGNELEAILGLVQDHSVLEVVGIDAPVRFDGPRAYRA